MAGTIKHEWNGTILTITSDSGTSSADLKGEKGDDGVRGAQGKPGGTCYNVSVAPTNLLDNSYFRNFINQRGNGSTDGVWDYCIDRWRAVGTVGQLVWHNSNHIALGALRGISQALENKANYLYKTYTLAVEDINGKKYVVSSVYGGDNQAIYGVVDGLEMRLYSVDNDNNVYFNVNNISSDTSQFIYLAWAALYEGAYTAETLPAYQYKGYAAELAECQRYYLHLSNTYNDWFVGHHIVGWGNVVEIPIQMRVNPTLIELDEGIKGFSIQGWTEQGAMGKGYTASRGNKVYIVFNVAETLVAGSSFLVAGIKALSADL